MYIDIDIEIHIYITGNQDAALFPSPDEFRPERWVSGGAGGGAGKGGYPVTGSAAVLPKGAWFPGGTGRVNS